MEPMHKINKVEVRNLQIEDYAQLSQSFKRVYADKDVFWTHEQIETLIRIFPEGQVVTVVDEKIVGCALSIIVDYDMVKGDHTYAKVTGNETFCTHNPNGNILYGIEVFIHPDYRGLRLARRMYEYRKELCEKLNLKAIMFGGRIPNYHKYADTMRPKEYLDKVRSREIYDPVLTFQLSNDFHVRRVMKNYLPNDEESKHCATLLQWDNIYYQPPTQDYVDKKTTVRVGLVQWQMRPYKTLDDVFEQVEFFVDAVSDYKSDFVLFPEYFNAPLMAKFNHLGEAQSIRGLAQYTEEVRDRFINLAISYNINIITGSMPYVKEDGGLYNVGFLVRRDGTYEMYEKAPANIQISHPLSNGVIADINNMEWLIHLFISDMSKGNIRPADFYIAVPTDITEVEKRAFYDLIKDANVKARKIMVVEKAIADGLGMDIDVKNSQGVLVVDIGYDTTEVSILSLGGIVLSRLIKTGGLKFDEAVRQTVRREFNLLIGQKTAATIRQSIGDLEKEGKGAVVYGRDIVVGLPVEREIPTDLINSCLEEHFNTIIDSVKVILERTPPELGADIFKHGVYLTGGASQTSHFAELLQKSTGLKVNQAQRPLESVVLGMGRILKEDNYKSVAYAIEGMGK